MKKVEWNDTEHSLPKLGEKHHSPEWTGEDGWERESEEVYLVQEYGKADMGRLVEEKKHGTDTTTLTWRSRRDRVLKLGQVTYWRSMGELPVKKHKTRTLKMTCVKSNKPTSFIKDGKFFSAHYDIFEKNTPFYEIYFIDTVTQKRIEGGSLCGIIWQFDISEGCLFEVEIDWTGRVIKHECGVVKAVVYDTNKNIVVDTSDYGLLIPKVKL
jgi:hypothetical protein